MSTKVSYEYSCDFCREVSKNELFLAVKITLSSLDSSQNIELCNHCYCHFLQSNGNILDLFKKKKLIISSTYGKVG